MTDVIDAMDLAAVPGLTANEDQLSWAASRASRAVAHAWGNPVEPVPAWVVDIAIDLAVRYLRNPSGVSSTTRSIDDASRTDRYEGASGSTGGFALTDGEMAALSGRVRASVGSMRLAVPGYQP